MAYTLLVENAIQRDGLSFAGALNEYEDFAAGAVDGEEASPVAATAEAEVAAQNEAALEEINQLMAGMRFR